MRIANLDRGGIRLDLDVEKLRFVRPPSDRSEGTRTNLKPGDVLISITAELGKIGYVADAFPGQAFVSQHLCLVRPRPDKVDGEYLAYLLSSAPYQTKFNRLSDAGAKAALNLRTVRELRVPVPSLDRQRKIAEILRAWDDSIDELVRLRDARKLEFTGLRVQVFGDQSAIRERWAAVSIRSIATRVVRKSDGAAHPVMTVSSRSGFVLQSDKYSRDMAGLSVANYTRLHKGEFAYNKGNSLTYPQGCVFALSASSALVPNVYFCFKLSGDLNPRFYEHLFAAGTLNRQLAQVISSGVRNNGLLNLSAEDFFNSRVPMPSRVEQDAVADVFDAATQEIDLLDRNLALLRTQKRGLMQKLLIGDVRLAPEAAILV